MHKDSRNVWITAGLFEETSSQYREAIRWTLDEAKKLFIDCNDPTGYKFATEYLGGYDHWIAIKESKALEHHIAKWEIELEAKLRYEGVKNIMSSAKSGNYQASKFMVDRGWDTRKAGRPTKKEKERHTAIEAKSNKDIMKHVKRFRKDA